MVANTNTLLAALKFRAHLHAQLPAAFGDEISIILRDLEQVEAEITLCLTAVC